MFGHGTSPPPKIMATLLKKDEINKLYREYFDIMDISEEQKEERIELAELLDDVFIYLFLYVETAIQIDDLDVDEVYDMGISRYEDVVANYGIDLAKHPDMRTYIEKMSKNIIDTTIKDAKKNDGTNKRRADDSANGTNDVSDSGNNVSVSSDRDLPRENEGAREERSRDKRVKAKTQTKQERAIEVAQNEANSIFNIAEYDDAVSKGYTKKTWITEGDSKVRETHQEVDFTTVDIDKPFDVGNCQMLYPKDISLGATADEIVNCRCSVYYE